MASWTEHTLPWGAKISYLKPLPGQDASRRFGVTDAIAMQPPAGQGYLVESFGHRKVRILAWIGEGGDIFALDAPASAEPDCKPDVSLRLDRETKGRGCVYVSASGGAQRKVAEFHQEEKRGKVAFERSRLDLGPYAEGYHDLVDALPALFLTFCFLPQEQGVAEPWRSASEVLADLLSASYPDALEALIYRGMSGSAPGAPEPASAAPAPFERYAAQALMAVGAGRVRSIAAQYGMALRRLSSTGLFWTVYDPEVEPDQEALLIDVEAVLNRLVLIARAANDLKSGGTLCDISEEFCRTEGMRAITGIARGAHELVAACEGANRFAKILGTECARGGEWDVRTRFASLAEHLVLPFRFSYYFDCMARDGVMKVDFSLPRDTAFPAECENRAAARTAYALRLTALVAAAAFGSGIGITRVVTCGHGGTDDGDALCSFSFDRIMFAMGTVASLRAGLFNDEGATVQTLLDLLRASEARISLDEDGAMQKIEPIDVSFERRYYLDPTSDTRVLSDEVKQRLHACTAADLDVLDTEDDPFASRFREVAELVDDEPSRAAVELQDMISAHQAAEMLNDTDARPLYCANSIARMMVNLTYEPGVALRKLPDSAFDARSVLSRAYRQMGNYEDAERLARECVELAPTSFASYHALALVFAEQERYAEAAKVMKEALRVLFVPNDIACAYYRLAYALWKSGNPEAGLACYVMVSDRSHFGRDAVTEAEELMAEAHIRHRPTFSEAEAVLRAEGIIVAPASELGVETAFSAIRLVDEGIFQIAKPVTKHLANIDPLPESGDVLSSVSRSLSCVTSV